MMKLKKKINFIKGKKIKVNKIDIKIKPND